MMIGRVTAASELTRRYRRILTVSGLGFAARHPDLLDDAASWLEARVNTSPAETYGFLPPIIAARGTDELPTDWPPVAATGTGRGSEVPATGGCAVPERVHR